MDEHSSTQLPRGVVVGVDTSAGARAAVRWAADEADRRGLPLTAVLAWSYLDQPGVTEGQPFVASFSSQDAREVLDGALADALGDRAATVERRTVNDHAAQALVDVSMEAALLVVGARGLGRFRGLVLGSVSSACLHHARCPVAVIRDVEPAQPHEPARVVVGVDGSHGSRRALAWAVEEARVRHAQLDVVHAWSAPVYPAHPLVPATFDPREFEDGARAVIEDTLASVDLRGLEPAPERLAVQGPAAASILDVAKGADLLVVGSRGRGGFTGLLLGSVSTQVARHAPCPVVIVPPERHER